jgi:3-hydroxybutyryl-CoA dehydrogenase
MTTVGVVGAGTMGTGIAYAAAISSMRVILYDVSPGSLSRGMARLASDLTKGVEKGKIAPDESASALARIRAASSIDDLKECDIVVEAVVEDLPLKQELFRTLGELCSEKTILATNTSSLSVTAIAAGVRRPERVVGMHFFNPAHIMKLVEVVQGHRTALETVESTRRIAAGMGKTPVSAKDTPGFIVNRVARPFYGEALRLLGEGVTTVEEIDRILTLEGEFKMGPFALMDLIGIDINFAVTRSMYEQTFGEPRYRPHPIQQQMVSAGLLGRKTKRGFYAYPE